MATGQTVRIIDTVSGRLRELGGLQSGVARVAFNHKGNLLATSTWDGVVRLWESGSGRLLISATGSEWIGFSPDDRWLSGAITESGPGVWEIADGHECRVLSGHVGGNGPWFVDFSPDGDLLASASSDGVRLWQPAVSSEPIALVPAGPCGSTLFSPDGRNLITSGSLAVYNWPIEIVAGTSRKEMTIREPRQLHDGSFYFQSHLSTSSNGLVIGASKSHLNHPGFGEAVVIRLGSNGRPIELRDQDGIESIAVSPDGRWVATGPWGGQTTKIRNGESGAFIHALPTGQAFVGFSPDGRWLVTGAQGEYRFWETRTWRQVWEIPRRGTTLRGPMAFTADGTTIAIAITSTEVQLIDVATRSPLSTLRAPTPGLISWLCFDRQGRRLAVACENREIHVWDLRAVHAGLASLGLDWGHATMSVAPETIRPVVVRVEVSAAVTLKTLESSKKWPEVVSELDRLIGAMPGEWGLYSRRGEAFAELGRWQDAARDYASAVRIGGSRVLEWTLTRHALTLLAAGDVTGYREACRNIVKRLERGDKLGKAGNILLVCSLQPIDIGDGEVLVRIADDAMSREPVDASARRAMGAALFRVGRLTAAEQMLQKAISLHSREGAPEDWLFLAMVDQRLGRSVEGRRRLDQAKSWLEHEERISATDTSAPWTERFMCRVLLGECMSLYGSN